MQHSNSSMLPGLVIGTSGLSLFCLLLLHFLSPEFEPHWRMVSEYALGQYPWLISLFFVFWGLSSILLSGTLWKQVTSKASKAGVILLFISGMGASLAALFDVSQPTGHGIAGLLGVPTVPIASLLITYHVSQKPEWAPFSKPIKILAHGTWMSLVMLIVAMAVMMTGFQKAGMVMTPDAPPPSHVPEGIIAVTGYVNRLLIVIDMVWLIFIARAIDRISSLKTQFNSI